MKFRYCLHCERVYVEGTGRPIQESPLVESCPFCGAGPFDQWDWDQVQVPNGYPDVPEVGKLYPLYVDEAG